jgi:DNA-binding MarR family transcriptional regulator
MASRPPLIDPGLADAAAVFTSIDHQSVFKFALNRLSVTADEAARALRLEVKRVQEILDCLVRKDLLKRHEREEGGAPLYSSTVQGARVARTLNQM